jgi:hypothetical protein
MNKKKAKETIKENVETIQRIPSEVTLKIREDWSALWPRALETWSKFTRLSEPIMCLTKDEERSEKLAGNFAMIRLEDHRVVLGLSEIASKGLGEFGLEIMAHEIGHHIYCPADLTDFGLMIARIRKGLYERKDRASMISNLYSDLLINDKLQQEGGLDMAGVYQAIKSKTQDPLWNLYMRIYEILWSLAKGTLCGAPLDDSMEGDSQLGARIIRVYHNNWLKGAGSFAALCYPYLKEESGEDTKKTFKSWMDTESAGEGGEPGGLIEMADDEDEIIHPSQDKNITGMDNAEKAEEPESEKSAIGNDSAIIGGKKSRKKFRDVSEYGELLKALRQDLTDHDIAIRYYRERALPHLIPFPVKEIAQKSDPSPEGLESWDAGMPLQKIDWLGTLMRSPIPIPGVTTVSRVYGSSPGNMPEKEAVDIYLGIDCSGSMPNPQQSLSYPVLAGTIIALSALRAGSRVMIVLSGEPGDSISTSGYENQEYEILKVLTGYLGTGYAFGIRHLAPVFLNGPKHSKLVHIIIITDSDIFSMLGEKAAGIKYQGNALKENWEVASKALDIAKGGGTYVLHSPYYTDTIHMKRMEKDGFQVHTIANWEDIIAFAAKFSKQKFG